MPPASFVKGQKSKVKSRASGFTQHLAESALRSARGWGRALASTNNPLVLALPQGLTCLRADTHKQAPCGQGAGFTILFAVLVGSLLFSMGVAIAHLSIKEIILSAAGKQSEIAFFAADTGIECALYWDRREDAFPDSEDAPIDEDAEIRCNKSAVPLNLSGGTLEENDYPKTPVPSADATAATTTFRLLLTEGCADVVVGKTKAGSTVVESRGRSDCGTAFNPSRVERALRARY